MTNRHDNESCTYQDSIWWYDTNGSRRGRPPSRADRVLEGVPLWTIHMTAISLCDKITKGKSGMTVAFPLIIYLPIRGCFTEGSLVEESVA